MRTMADRFLPWCSPLWCIDVLDEFNAPSSSAKPAATATPAPAAASSKEEATGSAAAPTQESDDAALDDALSQDFAKELAQGMQALMKELGGSANSNAEGLMSSAPTNSSTGASADQFNEEELMKQFEAMMAGFGGPPPTSSSSSSAPTAGPSSSKAASTSSG